MAMVTPLTRKTKNRTRLTGMPARRAASRLPPTAITRRPNAVWVWTM